MATIDDKVVAASFESSKFESGVAKTISSIDKLKKSLVFPNAGAGFDNLNSAANRVDLSHIGKSVDEIKGKFSAFNAVAAATIFNITNKVISMGTQMAKSLTLDPIMAGFQNYETQINAVQTILANTGLTGKKGLDQVNSALSDLNEYANKTVYNFSEMAKNIGTFTAAGVDLKTATGSIKGIANLAALSGSNSQQASTAMYQLSQAIAAGRVNLQDWNSVVNAGMGGKVFQSALANTAQAMGKLKDGSVKLVGPMKQLQINGDSFRNSISTKGGGPSWLTSDVLTKTLEHFTGDMTDAQLAAQGFSKDQIKAIQAQAKTAVGAATNIKTMSQMMQALKEEVASAWGTIFKTVFGDINGATKTFTALHNVLQNALTGPIYSFNKVLEHWAKMGGRKLFIHSLIVGFHDLMQVINPIKDAFRDIFPAKTGRDLLNATKNFHHLVSILSPSKDTVENLRRTFRGLFAVLDIGKQIVHGIFSVIGSLFGAVGKGSGSFLNLTGNIGDFLVNLDKSLKKGDKLTNFFNTLGAVLAAPIKFIGQLGSAIHKAFDDKVVGKAGKSLSLFQRIVNNLSIIWDNFVQTVKQAPDILKPAIEGISQLFGGIGQSIASALQGANFDAIFKVIEVSLLGGIFLTLKKALSGGLGDALAGGVLKSIVQAFTGVGGLTRSIGGTFNALTGSIQTMQQNVKSDTLKNIAISIALLSASMVGLSLVDPKRLNGALSAITIGFAQLLGAMAIMDKIGKSGGFIKMPVIAASMILLAGAIDVLAIAVYAMSKLSWEQLGKGLGAITVLLGGISAASGPLSANSKGMISAGIGIGIIAVALNILAKAVQTFGNMDLKVLEKGIGGVAAALAGIGLASKAFPPGMIAIGLGLIAVGEGLKIITVTIDKLGHTNMKVLAKGIGAITVALAGIGLAMRAMPGPQMILTAAGLILVGIALKSIAKTVGKFGGMSIEVLAKGLGALAASLLILTVALYAMSGTLAGAAALTVAAVGIALLAPALKTLGQQSWTEIIKGMVALAGALTILGVAGVILAPVVPAIIALGVALIAVGAGLALAGAGIALIGVGLGAIAVAGPAAVKILVDALTKLAESLPKVVGNLVKALLQLVTSVAESAPKFVDALGKIIVAMANALVKAAPALTKAFTALLQLIFKVLRDNFPGLLKTGFEMLRELLKGIYDNIGEVVKMVAAIIGRILSGIANSAGKLVAGGANILLAIVKGIGSVIGKIAAAIGKIIAKIIGTMASSASKYIAAGANVITKVVQGIGNAASHIVTAALKTVTKFISTIASQIPKEVDKVATAVIKMLNALADVIRKREAEFFGAMANIGGAIADGIIKGLDGLGKKILAKIKDEVLSLPGKGAKLVGKAIGKLPGIGSGTGGIFDVGEDLAHGLLNSIPKVENAVGKVVTAMASAVKKGSKISLGPEQQRVLNSLDMRRGNALHDFYLGVSGVVERNDQIDQAFSALNEKLVSSISDTRKKITDERQKMAEATKKMAEAQDKMDVANKKLFKDETTLQAAQKVGHKTTIKSAKEAIDNDKKAQKQALALYKQNIAIYAKNGDELARNTALLTVLTNTQYSVNHGFTDQQKKLHQDVVDLQAYSDALDEAKQKLTDIKQARDDFAKSTTDQFATLPDIVLTDKNGKPITGENQVANYEQSIVDQTAATEKFKSTLDQLRALGLDDKTLKKLLADGTVDQPFADALLKGGKGAVDALNAIDARLDTVAGALGDDVGHQLFDVGVNVAQSLVDGLESKKNAIAQEMFDLAESIVKSIKKALHIKSPSRVMAEIGRYSALGLAKGLNDSSSEVTAAVYGITDNALVAMKNGMAGISDAVAKQIDSNPTITPVLDLSQIRSEASKIGGVLGKPIAGTSLINASAISTDQSTSDETAAQTNVAPIQFVQNNNSPKALSSIEIYRLTKNQLARARPVLANP